jgi:hypothetical protein
VPKDATVYLKRPTLYIPQKKTARGKAFTRYQIKGKAARVEQVMRTLTDTDWVKLSVRITKEGNSIKTSYHVRTVYLALKEHGTVIEVKLLIRKDEDGTIRYALCNNLKASKHRLAFMHSQRYFIERSFQDTKQQHGLNEYQVEVTRGGIGI